METNQIKILSLLPYPVFPAKMGGQKAIAHLYAHLQKYFQITLVGTRNNKLPEDYTIPHLPWLHASAFRYLNLNLFFKIKNRVRQEGITHLIIEHPYFGWLAAWIKKATGIKLIVRSHNIESIRFKSTGKAWWKCLWHYEKWVHNQADLSFFITEEDREFAIKNYGLDPQKTALLTYGFDFNSINSDTTKQNERLALCKNYGIPEADKIILFNGTLDYKPNSDALFIIRNEIIPRLNKSGFQYKIIVCGKNSPSNFPYDETLIYAGFVPRIEEYLRGADIFINPVSDGGGIKTKLVEALGFNLSCISTQSGAIGIPAAWVEGKLIITRDGDWDAFSNAIQHVSLQHQTTEEFYNHFSWDSIVSKAAEAIKQLT